MIGRRQKPNRTGRTKRRGRSLRGKGKALLGILFLASLFVILSLGAAPTKPSGDPGKASFLLAQKASAQVPASAQAPENSTGTKDEQVLTEAGDPEPESAPVESSPEKGFQLESDSKPQLSLQRTALSLFVVLALIVLGIPLLKKLLSPGLARGTQGRLSVSETLPLGGRRYLCLVDVPGKTLVLGVTEDTIRNLSEIDDSSETSSASSSEAPSTTVEFPAGTEPESSFEQRLAETLNRSGEIEPSIRDERENVRS